MSRIRPTPRRNLDRARIDSSRQKRPNVDLLGGDFGHASKIRIKARPLRLRAPPGSLLEYAGDDKRGLVPETKTRLHLLGSDRQRGAERVVGGWHTAEDLKRFRVTKFGIALDSLEQFIGVREVQRLTASAEANPQRPKRLARNGAVASHATFSEKQIRVLELVHVVGDGRQGTRWSVPKGRAP